MPSIKILSESLRNKISAGEVIERPASVVKELIENSIDAQSTRINIEIKSAGKRLIKVTDNGIGMSKIDLPLSILPHATSKISTDDDLFNIKTLGFRGEALASISAVSRLSISSAEQDKEGLTVIVEGGKVIDNLPCSIKGTVIVVRDLFFNTPARLKFLKTDFTENHHIIDTVINLALCHEDIAFYLTLDNNETLQLPSVQTTIQRITQIFGKDLSDRLMSASASNDDYKLDLFYCKDNFYNNRKYQYVFTNNRPIKDISLSRAIYNALGEIVPKDMHPAFFLFIHLTPSLVDFNVHPAKREVRFRDRSILFDLIHKAITGQAKSTVSPIYYNQGEPTPQGQSFKINAVQEQGIDYKVSDTLMVDFIYLADTLIALPYEKGLLLLDYHAVHERINYERLLNRQIRKIPLLFPYHVDLDVNSYLAIKDNISLLADFGIEIEDFGKNSVVVRTMPDFAVNSDINTMMKDLAEVFIKRGDCLNDAVNPLDYLTQRLSASIACHSSLRGKGERPDRAHISHLLEQLHKTENPDYCPHGRPTKIFMSYNELLKRFKKI